MISHLDKHSEHCQSIVLLHGLSGALEQLCVPVDHMQLEEDNMGF